MYAPRIRFIVAGILLLMVAIAATWYLLNLNNSVPTFGHSVHG